MNESMKKILKKYLVPVLAVAVFVAICLGMGGSLEDLFGGSKDTEAQITSGDAFESTAPDTGEEMPTLDEKGSYTTKDDVALYIYLYKKLPNNFITKKEAEALGWNGNRLEDIAPGKCIGGDYFGNYEGLLPKKNGRTYTECDIDTLGASSRGEKRIVFSNDGLIYYTDDHYESFTLLYGVEE